VFDGVHRRRTEAYPYRAKAILTGTRVGGVKRET